MSFLAGLAADIVEWFLGKVFSFFKEEEKIREENAALKKQTQEDEDQLKAAQTIKEKEDAAQNIINHTFHNP